MDLKKLKQIIVPTSEQVLICLFASLVLFVMTYGSVLFQKTILSDPYVAEVSRTHLVSLAKVKAVDVIVKIIFWSSIGLVAYMIFLTISNVLIDARNSVVIESSYVNKGSGEDRLPSIVNRLLKAIVCLGWFVIAAKILLPWSLSWFEEFILAGPSWPALIIAVLSCSSTIYVGWTLTQVALSD